MKDNAGYQPSHGPDEPDAAPPGRASASPPATIRYVTRTGLFAEIIVPDPAWMAETQNRLAELPEDERREAVARYIAARYGARRDE